MTKMTVLVEDITTLAVDAIVTPANTALVNGGGINAYIHQAAGPQLIVECQKLGDCPVGEAKTTSGHQLASEHLIHTTIPFWFGGCDNEPEQLTECYRAAVAEARSLGATSIAFASLASGLAQFPASIAAEIAVSTVKQALVDATDIEQVFFVCTTSEDVTCYNELLLN